MLSFILCGTHSGLKQKSKKLWIFCPVWLSSCKLEKRRAAAGDAEHRLDEEQEKEHEQEQEQQAGGARASRAATAVVCGGAPVCARPGALLGLAEGSSERRGTGSSFSRVGDRRSAPSSVRHPSG